jgi:beta-lactam-binding protein with PASTA domain
LNYVDGGPQDSELPVGLVSSVTPAEGSNVTSGTTVTVYTSNGQAIAPPNVVGLMYGGGKSSFQTAGFTNISEACEVASGSADSAIDTIVAQSPAAQGVVNKSTPVVLTVRKVSCP